MKVTCDNCKNEIDVSSMYFNNERITTRYAIMEFEEDYIASVNGKTICPLCGKSLNKIFHRKITNDDILLLVTGVMR